MNLDKKQQEQLIERLFGQDDLRQQEDMERMLRDDSRLARADRNLRQMLARLEALKDIEPPANLVERTLRYVRQNTAGPVRLRAGHHAGDRDSQWRWALGNMRDLIATAAAILLIFLISQPGLNHIRNRSTQYQCASNLQNLGQGLAAYAANNDGYLPYQAALLPAINSGMEQNPVNRVEQTRHVYLLAQNGYVEPGVFCCPARRCQKEVCQEGSSTAMPCHYSFRVIVQGDRLDTLPHELMGADGNPLFMETMRQQIEETLDLSRVSAALLKMNSPNHNTAGQNALGRDGRVEFLRSRLLPVTQDDIYTIRDVRQYTGREVPGPDDEFLR